MMSFFKNVYYFNRNIIWKKQYNIIKLVYTVLKPNNLENVPGNIFITISQEEAITPVKTIIDLLY